MRAGQPSTTQRRRGRGFAEGRHAEKSAKVLDMSEMLLWAKSRLGAAGMEAKSGRFPRRRARRLHFRGAMWFPASDFCEKVVT
jgi:hypothetical protein